MRVKSTHTLTRFLPLVLFLLLLYFTALINYGFFKGESNVFLKILLSLLSVFYFYGVFIVVAVLMYFVNFKIINFLFIRVNNHLHSFVMYTIYLIAIYLLYILLIYNGRYDLSLEELYSSNTLKIAKYLDLRWIYLAMFLWQYLVELHIRPKIAES